MPITTTRISDFNEIQVSFGGHPLTGFVDGEAITITHEADAIGTVVGATGDVARFKTNDFRVSIEVRLMQTSPSNAALSAIYLADINAPGGAGVAAFLLTDLNGTTLITCPNCWIKRMPDASWGKEPTERVWMLEGSQIIEYHGGTI